MCVCQNHGWKIGKINLQISQTEFISGHIIQINSYKQCLNYIRMTHVENEDDETRERKIKKTEWLASERLNSHLQFKSDKFIDFIATLVLFQMFIYKKFSLISFSNHFYVDIFFILKKNLQLFPSVQLRLVLIFSMGAIKHSDWLD